MCDQQYPPPTAHCGLIAVRSLRVRTLSQYYKNNGRAHISTNKQKEQSQLAINERWSSDVDKDKVRGGINITGKLASCQICSFKPEILGTFFKMVVGPEIPFSNGVWQSLPRDTGHLTWI